MTPRPFHVAILRHAARLVPAPRRADWIAEWKAELCYVGPDATAFCWGSFRDALWIRCHTPGTIRRMFSLESPLRCVIFLAALALLGMAAALPLGELWWPAWSLAGAGQAACGCLYVGSLSLVVLTTLDPTGLGEYPVNGYAPSRLIRLRRWFFLAVKIALVDMIIWLAALSLVPLWPGAPSTLLFGWIFGSRWALGDQRQRCPVCLRRLSNPMRIGSPAKSILAPYGTELTCPRGHGSLYVPGAPTSWSSKQRWHYLDPTWGTPRP